MTGTANSGWSDIFRSIGKGGITVDGTETSYENNHLHLRLSRTKRDSDDAGLRNLRKEDATKRFGIGFQVCEKV